MAVITADEFTTWIKPADALKLLPIDWDEDTKRRAVLTRLAGGQIKAAAAVAEYRDSTSRPNVERFSLIMRHLWSHPWNSYTRDLWNVGDVTFDDAEPIPSVYVVRADELLNEPRGPTAIATLTGIRFHPVDFSTAFDLALQPDLDANESGVGKPIAANEMNRFVRLYLDLWGNDAREMKALAAIRSAYPESSISRDPFLAVFRELRGAGKRGKPPIRG